MQLTVWLLSLRCLLLGSPVERGVHAAAEAALKLVLGDSSADGSACDNVESLRALVTVLFCGMSRLRSEEVHAGLRDIMRWQGRGDIDDAVVRGIASQLRQVPLPHLP